ncbi:MAG: hypothetical protein MI743_05360 [Sneathiellales bacterium]|nr:hypothetical protein [Sneathiellales bacterium]
MSGIKSTSGGAATPPVESVKGSATTQQQVARVSPTSPSGGSTGGSVPQTSGVTSLAEGAAISAIVTARASAGNTMLHSEIGNFRMSTSSPLPVGAHVILAVENLGDIITAKLISLNGEKLASPPSVTLLPVLAAKPQSPGTYQSLHPGQGSTNPNQLQNVGSLINQTPGAGANSSTSETAPVTLGKEQVLPPKQSYTFLNLNEKTAATGASANASAGASAYSSAQSPALPSNVGPGNQNHQIASLLPNDNSPLIRASLASIENARLPASLIAHIKNSQLSLLQQPANSAVQSNTAVQVPQHSVPVQGIVSSVSSYGATSQKAGYSLVSVQSDQLGAFRYVTSTPPTVGSQLSFAAFEELQNFPLTNALPAVSLFRTGHSPLLSQWENLSTGLNLLAAYDPAQANSLLATRLPGPGNNLGSALLFFISALNGGSIDKWLGQDFRRTLDTSGSRDLMRALDDDFTTLSRLGSETGGQDWKLLPFPFLSDGQLKQLMLFYRQHGGLDHPDEEESTRFVIELDLSKTGYVQLDGLFKPQHFDLIFRSKIHLPEEMKAKVMDIFTSNLEITGIEGSLQFQQRDPFPINPAEEWESKPGSH